ncbi:hypothetical protein G6F31_015159 [Rhizopus arrhizus]|nr:hypothetical protein G6F31_015159 [Rhizopus arrhizus]
MIRQLLNRLTISLPVLLGVIVVCFVLLQVAPADPAAVIAGPTATADELAQVRQELGLDQPLLVQLTGYMWRLAHLDLGRSMISNVPVIDEIGGTIGATVELMLASVIWSIPLAILLGTLAARKPNGPLSQGITLLSVVGYSAPVFWTGIILIILFASVLPVFPVSDMRSAGGPQDGWAGVVDVLHHLALPAIALGLFYSAAYARVMRASMLEVSRMDYVRTAYAKGLTRTAVVLRHILRNAVLPIVTLLGLQLGSVLGGSIVVEAVFSWPGIGGVLFDSVMSRNYPVVLGILALSSFVVVLANIVVDLLYTRMDPRIKAV